MMNDEHFVEVTVGSSFIVHRLFFVFCPVHVFHISAFSPVSYTHLTLLTTERV